MSKLSQCTECELLSIQILVYEYIENRSETALDILELFIDSNTYSLDVAISEVLR